MYWIILLAMRSRVRCACVCVCGAVLYVGFVNASQFIQFFIYYTRFSDSVENERGVADKHQKCVHCACSFLSRSQWKSQYMARKAQRVCSLLLLMAWVRQQIICTHCLRMYEARASDRQASERSGRESHDGMRGSIQQCQSLDTVGNGIFAFIWPKHADSIRLKAVQNKWLIPSGKFEFKWKTASFVN